ncbi:MAG: toxin-antitoxin system YwqK family antitoxin [Bacteroidales bacterium]|nr:toxin-antitoxin system YwqK family antitoxin [Bacteroidales bacterium]
MEEKKFTDQIVSALLHFLYNFFVYFIFIVPFDLWKKATIRLANQKEKGGLNISKITSLWPFLSFLKAFILFFLILILTACSNKKEASEVQKRGDLYYELGSDDLYSGLIYSAYNEDLNQFEKEINDGKLHGDVKYWYPDGQIKSTLEYENGKLNGNSKSWYPNGQLKYSLNYEMGKLNGDANYWYSNGQIKHKFSYKKGVLDGADTTWYKNGNVNFWGSYSSGKQNGNWVLFNEDSDTIIEINYRDGLLNGVRKEYYPNGKLRISFLYKDEKLNGPVDYFNKNGDLVFRGNYINNKKNGKWIEYYDNGTVKLESSFIDDLKDTTWSYYGEYGNQIFNLNFKNDYPNGKGYILTDTDTLNLFFGFDSRLESNSLNIRGVDFMRGINFGLKSLKEQDDRTIVDFFVNVVGEGIILTDLVFFSVPHEGWGEGIDICPFDKNKKELWGRKEVSAKSESYVLDSKRNEFKDYKGDYPEENKFKDVISNTGNPVFTYFLSHVYYPAGPNNGDVDIRNYKGKVFDLKGMIIETGSRRWTQDGMIRIAIDSIYFKNGDKSYFYTTKDPAFVVKWVKSNSSRGYKTFIDHIDFLYKNNINDLILIDPMSMISIPVSEISDSEENVINEENNNELSSEEYDFDQSEGNITGCDEFLKGYEKFMNEYISIMKKYNANTNDASILTDYTKMLQEALKWKEFDEECANDPKFVGKYTEIQMKIAQAASGI